MANTFFSFKQFTVHQQDAGMKVTTDACLLGAWAAQHLQKGAETFLNALDIGTGTGLLALMLAQKKEIQIDVVEIENAAAEQARQNFESSPWKNRICLMHGDVQQLPLPLYDVIISNPPFYEEDLASPQQKRHLAHHGSGLKLQSLLAILQHHLKEAGVFFLLLPTKRQKDFETFLASTALYVHDVVWVQQTPAHAPFRMMIKGGKQKKELVEQSLTIKDVNGNYTPDFVALLKDYYLYL